MKTGGTKKQINGYAAFRKDDSTWIGLAEALAYLEWLEFQGKLWGYDCISSNRPNQDRIN